MKMAYVAITLLILGAFANCGEGKICEDPFSENKYYGLRLNLNILSRKEGRFHRRRSDP